MRKQKYKSWNRKQIEKFCDDNFIEDMDEDLVTFLKGRKATMELVPVDEKDITNDAKHELVIKIQQMD